jgi:hypothetical protein
MNRWVSAPGGKRWETQDGRWLTVRQNTAAGGPKWKLYRIVRGERVYRGGFDSLAAAKAAALARS